MIEVTVKRGAGDLPAPDIVEPLLSGSVAASTERGRIELNANGSPREKISADIVPMEGLSPNLLIEVVEQGAAPWRGIVDSLSLEISASVDDSGRLVVTRTVRVEVERDEIQ